MKAAKDHLKEVRAQRLDISVQLGEDDSTDSECSGPTCADFSDAAIDESTEALLGRVSTNGMESTSDELRQSCPTYDEAPMRISNAQQVNSMMEHKDCSEGKECLRVAAQKK